MNNEFLQMLDNINNSLDEYSKTVSNLKKAFDKEQERTERLMSILLLLSDGIKNAQKSGFSLRDHLTFEEYETLEVLFKGEL